MSLSSRAAGLSPGMKVFLLVDVVLVLALVVVAALVVTGALGGGGGSTDTASDVDPSASQPAAAPTASPTAAPTGVESFATQTRNIACTMRDDGVTCTIASKTFVPPGAESCGGTIGHVVEASADGIDVPCVDGPAPGPAGPDVPVLEYGLTSTVGAWTCTSATNGVTCVEDATGAGFRLARAELVEVG